MKRSWQQQHGFRTSGSTTTMLPTLKCKVCAMYEAKLIGMRNLSRAFIDGCSNLKASAYEEHASSVMHQTSMVLYKKSQSVPVTDYVPIAKAL